jgi:hypothetical protein
MASEWDRRSPRERVAWLLPSHREALVRLRDAGALADTETWLPASGFGVLTQLEEFGAVRSKRFPDGVVCWQLTAAGQQVLAQGLDSP